MPAPRTRTRRPETVPPRATTLSETRCPTASERGVTRSAVQPTVGGAKAPLTVVVATAVLLDGAGSGWLPSTVATFVIVPGDCGCTTTVIVALAPPASVPSEQTIVGWPEQLPWLALTETRVTPAGSWSVTVTPVAVAALPFVARIV